MKLVARERAAERELAARLRVQTLREVFPELPKGLRSRAGKVAAEVVANLRAAGRAPFLTQVVDTVAAEVLAALVQAARGQEALGNRDRMEQLARTVAEWAVVRWKEETGQYMTAELAKAAGTLRVVQDVRRAFGHQAGDGNGSPDKGTGAALSPGLGDGAGDLERLRRQLDEKEQALREAVEREAKLRQELAAATDRARKAEHEAQALRDLYEGAGADEAITMAANELMRELIDFRKRVAGYAEIVRPEAVPPGLASRIVAEGRLAVAAIGQMERKLRERPATAIRHKRGENAV